MRSPFAKNPGMSFLKRKGVIDIIVVFALFTMSALLVLGLFPKTNPSQGRLLYLYTMMTIPIIIAVYFILISFRRSMKRKGRESESGLRAKITIILLFVAILPLLPVVLISNNMIQRMINTSGYTDTHEALSKAVDMSKNEIIALSDDLRIELDWMKYVVDKNIIPLNTNSGREHLTTMLRNRGFIFQYYKVINKNDLANGIEHVSGDAGDIKYSLGVRRYASIIDSSETPFITHLSVEGNPVILGGFTRGDAILLIYRDVPGVAYQRIVSFSNSLNSYILRLSKWQRYQSLAGLLLLIVSIVVLTIAIGLSLYLARSITSPVLAITNAARSVAAGNLDVQLTRKTSDEIALLFDSFNTMTRQLKENREAMYIAQKLNAWREVSRKLLHEIKNPLTPIKLSAERIKLRYAEKHPEIGSIINKGTDTIIEEVNAIQRILDEFTNFARLPEVKPERHDLNQAVKGYAALFHGHERVTFEFGLDPALPDVLFDKLLLRLAVINIIRNSIEAMNGEGSISIRTGLVNPKTVNVVITDTGPGISAGDIPFLFEPTFTRKKGGTGLGLAIVEKIALDHKGKVYCTSEPGKGATFTIELPVAQE
jgi:nitrogen fixation/metabolism regulation signal transduction histidine kinase